MHGSAFRELTTDMLTGHQHRWKINDTELLRRVYAQYVRAYSTGRVGSCTIIGPSNRL